MKNCMKVFASTALVAIGSVALVANAYGQEVFEAIPTNCIIFADEVLVDGSPFISTGTMDLEPGTVVSSDPAAGRPASMQLINAGFTAQSEDEALGILTWELDDSRPVETSILQSNQADALFPATVQLDFNVRATISTREGVFLSRTPISIVYTDVQSWPPGDIDGLNSIEGAEVEFFDEGTGETAFIVNRVNSRVRD